MNPEKEMEAITAKVIAEFESVKRVVDEEIQNEFSKPKKVKVDEGGKSRIETINVKVVKTEDGWLLEGSKKDLDLLKASDIGVGNPASAVGGTVEPTWWSLKLIRRIDDRIKKIVG